MSPLFTTSVALIAAVAWMAIPASALYLTRCIGQAALYMNALIAAVLVSIVAFASMVSWWTHPLRDTQISTVEGFTTLFVGIICAVMAMRLRKVIMTKFGFDPIPR